MGGKHVFERMRTAAACCRAHLNLFLPGTMNGAEEMALLELVVYERSFESACQEHRSPKRLYCRDCKQTYCDACFYAAAHISRWQCSGHCVKLRRYVYKSVISRDDLFAMTNFDARMFCIRSYKSNGIPVCFLRPPKEEGCSCSSLRDASCCSVSCWLARGYRQRARKQACPAATMVF